MAVDYGLSLGFPQQSLIAALLITQFVGFPAALVFGWLGSASARASGIFIAIAVYAGPRSRAYWMREVAHFYVLAVVIGLVQGGVQSLSRSLLRVAGARGQAGRVLRLLQHDGQVRRGARADDGRRHGARRPATRAHGMLSIVVLFVGGALLLARSRRVGGDG